MKKLIHILLLIMISLSIASCRQFDSSEGSIIYWPNKIDSRVKDKTKMKPFDHLENPIVVAIPLYEKHNLFGVEKWDSRVWQKGNILVVFDTESESIYDWAFSDGSLGWPNYQLLPIKNTWWMSGENGVATKLDASTGEISVYEHGISSSIQCHNLTGNSFLLDEDSFDSKNRKNVTYIYSFNTDKCELEYNWEIYNDDYIEEYTCDSDGNFYACYSREKRKYFVKLKSNGDFEERKL